MAAPDSHPNGLEGCPTNPPTQEGHYYHVLEAPYPSYRSTPPRPPKRAGSQSSLTSSSSGGSANSPQLQSTKHPHPRSSPPTPPRSNKSAYKPRPGNTMSLPHNASKVLPESLAHLHNPKVGHTGDMPSPLPPLLPLLHPRTSSLGDSADAPEVPNTPRPRSQTAIVRKMSTKPIVRQVSDGMSLSQLARNYSKSCPLQIRILKGYCGQTTRLTLSSQDTFNVHFLKRVKVVVVQDAHGSPYSIPLNSAVEFGLVYDPNNDRSQGLEGHRFERVADILALSDLPKVLCTQIAVRGDSEKTTFFENEVLVIKGVQKARFKAKRSLKVYSVLMKTDKVLSEDFTGSFTTTPYLCKMHLPELMEHVPNPFPSTAMLYLNTETYHLKPHAAGEFQDLPNIIFEKVMTVEKCITETTLVASSVLRKERKPAEHSHMYHEDGSDIDRDILFDIPVDEVSLAEVEVAVVELENTEDTEKLYDDTRSIFERFDPSKVISCKDTNSQNAYNAQSFFYTAVREGCETVGVELEQPSAIYDRVRSHFMKLPLPTAEGSSTVPTVDTSSKGKAAEEAPGGGRSPRKLDRRISGTSSQPPLPRSPIALKKEPAASILEDSDEYDLVRDEVFTSLPQSPSKAQGAPLRDLERRVSFLESKKKGADKDDVLTRGLEKMKRELAQVSQQVSALQGQFQHLSTTVTQQQQQQRLQPGPGGAEGGSVPNNSTSGNIPSFQESNVAFLVTMDTVQVQNLLEAMGLSQYKDTFSMEQVTGEILVELSDQDLRNDLGINSRVHRLRLLKVMSGHHAAENILAGVDPYVRR